MELKELIKKAGTVGAGGAGFPSYAKLAEEANTLLINGSECEPLLYTDYVILKRELSTVLDGAAAIAEGSRIKRILLCVKSHTAKRLSFTDGEALSDKVTVKVLRDSYPIGDEISLIYEACGKVVRPGQLPISEGVIVYNVETVYNIARYVIHSEPVITKWITVGGNVPHPAVINVPIGTPISHIFHELGVEIGEDDAVLDGGPSMGKIINPDIAAVTKTTKAILVLPRNTRAVESKLINERMATARAETACCQCTRCTDMCPRHLLGYPLEPHKMVRTAMQAAEAMPVLIKTATLCCGCGICESIACSQGISPRAVINGYKAVLAKNKMKYIATEPTEPRPEREYRIIPSQRWQSTLGVARFDKIPEFRDALPSAARVEISLTRHVGAPSVPTVKSGDVVKRGDLIAEAAEGLSVPQHATVSGRVTVARDKIIIDRENY